VRFCWLLPVNCLIWLLAGRQSDVVAVFGALRMRCRLRMWLLRCLAVWLLDMVLSYCTVLGCCRRFPTLPCVLLTMLVAAAVVTRVAVQLWFRRCWPVLGCSVGFPAGWPCCPAAPLLACRLSPGAWVAPECCTAVLYRSVVPQ